MAHVENNQKQEEQGAEKKGLLKRLEKAPQVDTGAMSPRKLKESFQNLLTCPVCSNRFRDPVTMFSGNTVCQCCVPQGFPGASINWRMKNMVTLFEELKPRLEAPPPPVPGPWCPEHDEPLALLCLEDNRRICQVCKYSSLHRSHTLFAMAGPDL